VLSVVHDGEGKLKYRDIGLGLFEGTHVEVESFARHLPEIASYQLAGPHGVIVLSPKVTATSLASSSDLVAIGRP